jgi:hypothetical protein
VNVKICEVVASYIAELPDGEAVIQSRVGASAWMLPTT